MYQSFIALVVMVFFTFQPSGAHAASACRDFDFNAVDQLRAKQWANVRITALPASLMRPGECWGAVGFAEDRAASVHALLKKTGIATFMIAKNGGDKVARFSLLNITEAAYLNKAVVDMQNDIDRRVQLGMFKPEAATRLKAAIQVSKIGTFKPWPGKPGIVTVYELRYVTSRADLGQNAPWLNVNSPTITHVGAIGYVSKSGSSLSRAYGVMVGIIAYAQVGVGQSYEAKQARDSFKYLVPIAGAGG